MDQKRLEFIFRKKHAPHLHAHPLWHTHDSIYARVYTCTHCGRKSHLAKFCYARLNDFNFISKNVWVRRGINPHDPRKFVYQKSFLFLLMQVWDLTRRESIDALVVDAFEINGHYIGCIPSKDVLVGEPPCFGDIETSLSVW